MVKNTSPVGTKSKKNALLIPATISLFIVSLGTLLSALIIKLKKSNKIKFNKKLKWAIAGISISTLIGAIALLITIILGGM
ncbi:hypothetical protein [Mycoplasmopsis gallopavonis]|uniref:hypothetical protein n=1 Tax=Mycoplasmopsis gallopavonis TaxID=76629 RepID=UPI000E697CAF|nr:hypothetical protein [Mycoplasmopsis gallopavonis]RIV16452.1 hypothetical protein D1113_02325 [Mycoplasmopsis gallopavonis]